MPTYCYERMDNGETLELPMTMEEMSRRQSNDHIVLGDGVVAKRRYDLELGKGARSGDHWRGHASLALAVHPDQIPEVMEEDKKRGITTEGYTSDGRPRFSSKGQKTRYMRSYQFHDKDGYD